MAIAAPEQQPQVVTPTIAEPIFAPLHALPRTYRPGLPLLEPTEFRKRLEEEIKGRHSAAHPFSKMWANGELSRQNLADWTKQHLGYVGTFTDWLGVMYAKCPHRDAKDFLLQNMWEEEMGQRHTDLLLRFGEACGASRSELLDPELYPQTRAMQAWCRDLATNWTYLEATAGLVVGLESQVPAIYIKQLPVLKEKYGFTDEEVKFFKIHITSDIVHGERGFQIVLRYARTVEDQQRCIQVCRWGAQMRRMYLDGLYRHSVQGEPL
jgi:pyrroloquinoline-quinone synthase